MNPKRFYAKDVERMFNVQILGRDGLYGKDLDGYTVKQRKALHALGMNITGIRYKGEARKAIQLLINREKENKPSLWAILAGANPESEPEPKFKEENMKNIITSKESVIRFVEEDINLRRSSRTVHSAIELQIFHCRQNGKQKVENILIKSFYKVTKYGIRIKYAPCSYNRNSQKPEWCFNTLREAINAAEEWLTTNGYIIVGYVANFRGIRCATYLKV